MRIWLLCRYVNSITVFITTIIYIENNNRDINQSIESLNLSPIKVSTKTTSSNEKIITELSNSMIRHFTPSFKSSSPKTLNLNEGHFVLGNEFPNLDLYNEDDISDDYDETIEKNINNKNDDFYNSTFLFNNRTKDKNVLSTLTNLTFLGKTSQLRLALPNILGNQTYLSLDNYLGKLRFKFANDTLSYRQGIETTVEVGDYYVTDKEISDNFVDDGITEEFVTTTNPIVITMSEKYNGRTTEQHNNFKVVNSDVTTMHPSAISENAKSFEFNYDFGKTIKDNTTLNFQNSDNLEDISGVDISSLQSWKYSSVVDQEKVATSDFPEFETSSNFQNRQSSYSRSHGLSFEFNEDLWRFFTPSTSKESGSVEKSQHMSIQSTISSNSKILNQITHKSKTSKTSKTKEPPKITKTKSKIRSTTKLKSYKSITRETKDNAEQTQLKSSLTPFSNSKLNYHKPQPTIKPHNHSYLSNGMLLSTSPIILFIILILM